MVDLKILKEKGVSTERLKEIFNHYGLEEPAALSQNQQSLKDLIRSRVQRGIDRSLTNWRIYYALDQAWDSPFHQTSATLMKTFMDDPPKTVDDANRVLKDFGLTHLMTDSVDKSGKATKELDTPTFYQVLVPLVKAYVTIRWAKITNDRNLLPFMSYEPYKDTAINRLRGEIITDRIEKMNHQYGYFDIFRQAVFQTLHYSYCLQFPVEEWHKEIQEIHVPKGKDPDTGIDPSDNIEIASDVAQRIKQSRTPVPEDKDLTPKEVIVKEGMRYHMPHPSRMFWDIAHRPSTFNTDTGCTFAGYWRVHRWGDIRRNSEFWNLDRVTVGTRDLREQYPVYFEYAANACTIKYPHDSIMKNNQTLRENQINTEFYSADTQMEDSAVTISEVFMKLVPSEWDLGSYSHPVWFRFVVANEDTLLYAAPLPYCPVIYYGYDQDENREKNSSLTLEVLPFQDQISNQLSQAILTVKQNLSNLILVDQDVVHESYIDKVKNLKNAWYSFLNVVPFQGRKLRMQQKSTDKAVQSFKFDQNNPNESINTIKVLIDIMERLLVMSSQEVGQAATHEQTREEIRNIAANTSSRLMFTAAPIDRAMGAWKKQLYQALMAYGAEQTYAQISDRYHFTKEDFEKLGLTVIEHEDEPGKRKSVVVKRKAAMLMEDFIASRESFEAPSDSDTARAMSDFVLGLVNSPVWESIGPAQTIQMVNMIARMAGFPRDFNIRDVSEENNQAMKQQIQEIAQEIQKTTFDQVMDAVKRGLEPIAKQTRENSDAIQTLNSTVAQNQGAIQAAINQAPQPPATSARDAA